MVSIGTIFYTLFSRLVLIILISILIIPLAICLLLPKKLLVDNAIFKVITRFFYWGCIKLSFLPITYKGMENIPHEPCIITANHQSSFDIPLIGYALKKRLHVWLAWSEIANWPLVGFIVTRNAVLVDMTSPAKGLRTLVQAINIVKEHPWDLIIFPEGGRFTDGTVHDFFGGFAAIAKKISRPVVPIKIIGVNKVYPPKTFWIYYHPITVVIGKPMVMQPNETEEAFKDRVYNWYMHEINE